MSRMLAVLIAVAQVLLPIAVLAPGMAMAQVTSQDGAETPIDIDPPTLTLERVEQGVAGENQVFSATIEDNVGVTEATLHYRFENEPIYRAIPMQALGRTAIYTASVDTAGVDATVIQYYIEAKDGGGNRTIQGFAFDPLERELVPAGVAAPDPAVEPVAAEPAEPVVDEAGMSTGRKVLYGVLGLLAVGALVAAADSGDDDGGGGGGEPGGGDVPLTIITPPLQ